MRAPIHFRECHRHIIDLRRVLLVECIQEGLWRHLQGRLFLLNVGLEKEAKSRLSFLVPHKLLISIYGGGVYRFNLVEWYSPIWQVRDGYVISD